MSADLTSRTPISRIMETPAGAKEACLVMIYGTELGRKHNLDQPSTVIGRSSKSDIQIDQVSISRTHCKIINTGKSFILRDLGSTNGTYINDDVVDEHVLRDADLIKIGRSIFKFLTGGNIENAYHEEIYRLTTVDGLTQVYNKRYFLERLESEVARGLRYGRELSLIMLDLDHFKQINDTFGHLAGDHVLKHLACVVKERLRREDIVARCGGQEFSILLPEVDNHNAARFGQKIRRIVERTTFKFEDTAIPVTISIGVASITKKVYDPTEIVRLARTSLQAAKAMGRNCVVAGSDNLRPGGCGPGAAATTSAEIENRHPIPELWFKRELGQAMRRLSAEPVAVVVGACALRDQLALLANQGRPLLERCKRVLFDVLVTRLGERPTIAALPDGVYLYLSTSDSEASIDALRRELDQQFAAAIARLSLAPAQVELCHGFAFTTDSAAPIDDLMDNALSNLRAPADPDSLLHWPHPIARALKGIEAGDRAVMRVNAWCTAMEAVLRFLSCVSLATLAKHKQILGDDLMEALGKNVSMGTSLQVLRDACQRARGKDWVPLSALADSLLGSRGRATINVFAEIVKRRNVAFHNPGKGDDGASIVERELEPLCSAALSSLNPLAAFRMATVTGFELTQDGRFLCTLRDHSGPDTLFSVDRVERTNALPNGTYLLARFSEDFLRLSPLIVLADCSLCGQGELMWTRALRVEAMTVYEGVHTGHRNKLPVDLARLSPVLTGRVGAVPVADEDTQGSVVTRQIDLKSLGLEAPAESDLDPSQEPDEGGPECGT